MGTIIHRVLSVTSTENAEELRAYALECFGLTDIANAERFISPLVVQSNGSTTFTIVSTGGKEGWGSCEQWKFAVEKFVEHLDSDCDDVVLVMYGGDLGVARIAFQFPPPMEGEYDET